MTLPLHLVAQVPDDAAQRVDAVFASWHSVTSPGCAIGVTRNGLTVLERAYGMADLEHGIANTPATIFPERNIGRLADGYEANFLVLAVDPIENWKNTERIELRVKQGWLFCARK